MPTKTTKTTTNATLEITIRNDIKKLEDMFTEVNARFFKGELPTPIITIQRDTEKAYGWFTSWKAWQANVNGGKYDADNGYYEINVSADYMNRSPIEIICTLVHECIHLYAKTHGIKDTSRGGSYHNKEFKSLSEKYGLKTEANQKYGFITNGFDDERAKLAQEIIADIHFDFWRYQPPKAKVTKKKKTTFKFTCPQCGNKVWGHKRMHIVCGDCGLRMIDENEDE